MKKMILYILFCVSISNPIIGQERTNKTLPKLSAPISSLNQAKGYYYNKDGQWIEHDKNIANMDDFKKIEFRIITYERKELLVLLKYNDTGYFEYPTISEGWSPYTKITFYLLDKEVYNEEILKCGTSCLLGLNILHQGILAYSSTFIKDIEIEVSNYFKNLLGNSHTNEISESKSDHKLYIQYKNYLNDNISRFFIFEEKCINQKCEFGGFTSSLMYVSKEFNKLKTDDIYSLYYYETKYSLFKNFINLKKNIVRK